MFWKKNAKPVVVQTGINVLREKEYGTTKNNIIRLLGIDFLQILPIWVLGIIILITDINIPKITIAENMVVVAIVTEATNLLKTFFYKYDKKMFRFVVTLVKEIVLCAGSVIYVLILIAEHHDNSANMVKEDASTVVAVILLLLVFGLEIFEICKEDKDE